MLPYKRLFENTQEVEKEYQKFVRDLVNKEDLNFHPDTPFKDYVDDSHKPTFSKERAKELQDRMNYFFDKLGDKVYDYDYQWRKLKKAMKQS